MRLYIIGNVCSISASATAIQPTNIPTHNPNIAIIIFPQILITGTFGIFVKPRLYAVSSTDDILPATTPHIMTFSISIIFSILLHRSIRGTTPITSTNANTPADTPAPAKNAITDKIISRNIYSNILLFLYLVYYCVPRILIMLIHLHLNRCDIVG